MTRFVTGDETAVSTSVATLAELGALDDTTFADGEGAYIRQTKQYAGLDRTASSGLVQTASRNGWWVPIINGVAAPAPGSSYIYRPGAPTAAGIYNDPWALAFALLAAGVPADVYVNCTFESPAPWPVDLFLPNVAYHPDPVSDAPAILQLVKGTNPQSGAPTDGTLWFPRALDAVVVTLGNATPGQMVSVGQIFGQRFSMTDGAQIVRPNDAAPLGLFLVGVQDFEWQIVNCLDPIVTTGAPTSPNAIKFFGAGGNPATLTVLAIDNGPEFALPPITGPANGTLDIRYDNSVPLGAISPQPAWAGTFHAINIDGSGGGGDIQNPREAYLSEDIGNDVTGNGTIGQPWKTIDKAISFLPSVGFCRLAAGGYGDPASPASFTPTQVNIEFEGVHSDFGSQSQVNGGFVATGGAGRVKVVGINFLHGPSLPAFLWDDVIGRHYIIECGETGATNSAPFLHATSNARNFAYFKRCDLTGNLAPYNVLLDDLPAGQSATLYIEDVQGLRCSVGVGWTVVCQSAMADALFSISAGGNVVWQAPMPDQAITILQSQADLNAATAAAVAGYFVCVGFVPTGLPTGATTGDVLSKPAVAGFMGLYRTIQYAPPTINGLVGGVLTPYRQTAAGWSRYPGGQGLVGAQTVPASAAYAPIPANFTVITGCDTGELPASPGDVFVVAASASCIFQGGGPGCQVQVLADTNGGALSPIAGTLQTVSDAQAASLLGNGQRGYFSAQTVFVAPAGTTSVRWVLAAQANAAGAAPIFPAGVDGAIPTISVQQFH